ncbi:aldehyde reductase [Flavobacteriaceae bacterium]|jgi:dihydroflavonol-4-reductase|nr:aldehyde reductase [Flavobacteriaceae bacterium]MDA8871595.1 aldehyde reductase [Flavobacteriaceae bacterium]MDA9879328.1 aldehyde reductase [Flavobacteriaceae bacterium]MDC6479089.1 aldehyde reductase [Flavobacteriaceae bacterium]
MNKKVLLTGISGYIGNHCAVELLKNGYSVRGSVRSLSKSKQVTDAIKKEVDPRDNLEFCELDLLSDDGWDDAIKGCEFLMHVASPFINIEPKDENEYIRPAVDGTIRALNAAKSAGIKRVVLTSSMVSMLENADKSINVDAESWTNVKAKNVSAYSKSKTLAERAAWEFISGQTDDKPMELSVVNPGPVFGPTLSGDLSGASMGMFKQMMVGKMPMMPQASINMSDVRDIAKIHVLALENEKADGKRFIVTTEEPIAFQDVAKILKSNGYDKVSTKLAPNFLLKIMGYIDREAKSMRSFIGKTYNGDVSSTMEVFDWNPIPFKKTVLDTAKSIDSYLNKN